MKKKIFLGLGIALFGVIAFAAMGHLKSEPTVYFSQDYENGAALDWSNNVGGRFDAEIGESADGNHYMRAAAGTRTSNGAGMYSNAINVAAGTPFTMTADIRLRSANGQNGAEFVVGAAGASYNFSKWEMTGKMVMSIKQVAAGGTNQWVLNGDVDNPITLPGTETLASTDASAVYDAAPWYTFQLSWKDGETYFSIKDKATGTYITKWMHLNTKGDFASEGGIGQLWFQTSRYNAAFAIDNIVVREVLDGDLPKKFNPEAATEVPVTMATYIHAEGKLAPAGCQDIAYYDATATVWQADFAKISGGVFSNQNAEYGGAMVTLAKFDLSEYELPFDYEIESVSLSLHATCTTSGKNSNVHGVGISNGNIDLTTATWNNTNTADVLGTITDLGTIGNANSSGATMSKDITEYYNSVNGNVFMFGFYTESGRTQDLSDIKLIVKVKKIIHETNLAYFINEAVKDKAAGEDAVLDLDPEIAYTFDTPVDAGLVNLTINGGGKTIALADSVQIATQASLTINDINFDCAANTKLAPIAMSANPDPSLVGERFQTEGTTLRANGFYDTGAITLNNCNFSEVKTSLVSANKREWYLKGLTIKNCIVQFDVASGIDSYINWYGNSNNEGSIKDIVIENSTLYNIVENNDNRFLHYQNNSNSQPQKAWAEPQFDGKASWTMKNNTFVNLPSNKEFANNYPNKNNVTLDFKGNIFYNTWRLQKIASNAVRNFTAADNAICGITNAVDGTDAANYATEDTLLCKGDAPFVVPTTALDLTNVDLSANFTPCPDAYATEMGYGDPRWKGTPANVLYSQDYEKVGVEVDWKTGTSGRYDPMIATEDGNHYLCANPANCNNNGATMTSLNTAHAEAGTDFTMSVDVRLGCSNNQTYTEFDIFDAANVVKLLSVRAADKSTTKWLINETDTLDLPGTDNGAYVEGRPWYKFTITMCSGVLFVSAKALANDSVLIDKKVYPTQTADGGVGKMQFISSRYNSAFAIDNVLVRKFKQTDLPEGLVPAQYTINYIYNGSPIKEPRVGSSFVGYEVAVKDADMAAIYDKTGDVINKKYLYESGAEPIILVEDPTLNVINLVFRLANQVQYKLTGSWGATEKTINLIKKGNPQAWEGEKVLSYYPEYILDGDSLGYLGSGQQVTNQFTYEEVLPGETYIHKLPYKGGYSTLNQVTPGVIKNVVFFSEAEELPGFTKSEQINQGIRCSSGYCAYNLNDTVIKTLEPGTYFIAVQFWGGTASAQWEIGKFEIGNDILSVSTTGSRGQAVKTVTVTEPTDVVVRAVDPASDYKNSGYDWILIQKLTPAEITVKDINIMEGDTVAAADYVTSTSTAAITYKSSDEEIVKVVDGNVVGVGAGETTIIVSQAEADGYMAATDTIKVTVKAYGVLPALPASATYSWQSPRGIAEEVGGKAVALGDTTRVNYGQAPANTQYYTICLIGKKNLAADKDGIVKYITVNLDQALAEGDTIYVYAFKNKDDASKKAGIQFLWGAEGTSSAMACGDDFPNLYNGGEPKLVKYVVPADAAGQTTFRMTRSETGTNLFIAQLAIVPQQTPTGINEVKNSIFNGEGMYNVRGQKITKANKGEIIIVNGKKYIAK